MESKYKSGPELRKAITKYLQEYPKSTMRDTIATFLKEMQLHYPPRNPKCAEKPFLYYQGLVQTCKAKK